jgi:hypothetical protein
MEGRKARCVVWRGRGVIVPAQLERALVGAGCVGVHVQSEFSVVAELCRARAVGELSGGAHVLLMVEPAELPGIGELLEVVERYVPGAVLWAYEASPSERIRAVTEDERASWTAKPKGWLEEGTPAPEPRVMMAPPANPIGNGARATRNVKITNGSAPKLKLTGEGPPAAAIPAPGIGGPPSDNGAPTAAGTPETTPARAAHMLTDEELAMLLAIEPDKGHN